MGNAELFGGVECPRGCGTKVTWQTYGKSKRGWYEEIGHPYARHECTRQLEPVEEEEQPKDFVPRFVRVERPEKKIETPIPPLPQPSLPPGEEEYGVDLEEFVSGITRQNHP